MWHVFVNTPFTFADRDQKEGREKESQLASNEEDKTKVCFAFWQLIKKEVVAVPHCLTAAIFLPSSRQHEIYSNSITHCFVAIGLVPPIVKTGLNAAILSALILRAAALSRFNC